MSRVLMPSTPVGAALAKELKTRGVWTQFRKALAKEYRREHLRAPMPEEICEYYVQWWATPVGQSDERDLMRSLVSSRTSPETNAGRSCGPTR